MSRSNPSWTDPVFSVIAKHCPPTEVIRLWASSVLVLCLSPEARQPNPQPRGAQVRGQAQLEVAVPRPPVPPVPVCRGGSLSNQDERAAPMAGSRQLALVVGARYQKPDSETGEGFLGAMRAKQPTPLIKSTMPASASTVL